MRLTASYWFLTLCQWRVVWTLRLLCVSVKPVVVICFIALFIALVFQGLWQECWRRCHSSSVDFSWFIVFCLTPRFWNQTIYCIVYCLVSEDIVVLYDWLYVWAHRLRIWWIKTSKVPKTLAQYFVFKKKQTPQQVFKRKSKVHITEVQNLSWLYIF